MTARAHRGPVLGRVQVKAVFYINVAAEVLRQVSSFDDLNDKVNPLVDELTWLVGDEVQILGAVGVDWNDVEVKFAMHLECRADQVDSGRVINQVGKCFQRIVAFPDEQRLRLIAKRVLDAVLSVLRYHVAHHHQPLPKLLRGPEVNLAVVKVIDPYLRLFLPLL